MIINATSKIIKNIFKPFLFIFIAFIILILTLREGVRIQDISLPFVKVTQFYIKLDKKLIVSAKDVKLSIEQKQTSSYAELKKATYYIPFLDNLFESISIQNLIYENNTVHFLYKNNIFYIDTQYLTIDSSIKEENDNILLDIKELILKDFDAKFKGDLEVNFAKDKYTFDGQYNVVNLAGSAHLILEDNTLFYRIDSQEIESIEPFMEYINTKIDIEPQINNWVYKNIIAKKYTIENLEGMFDIKTFDYYPNSIKGSAKVQDVNVSFNPDVPPAHIKDMQVILNNDTLVFETESATYQGKEVKNPKVYIYQLMTLGSGIIVDLESDTLLDDAIHKILKGFHIDIPLTQSKGENSSSFILDVDFNPVSVKTVNGIFQFKNTSINLAGLEMTSQNGIVKLENDLLLLENVHMKYQDLFDINATGVLDLSALIFQGTAQINSINIDLGKNNLLHVKDKESEVNFVIDTNATKITLVAFDTELIFKNKGASFVINDITKLKQNSALLQKLHINEGNALIETDDYKNFKANVIIKNTETPFYKNGLHVKDFNLHISTNGEKFQAINSDESLKIFYDNGLQVDIKDLDIGTDFSKEDDNITDISISINAQNSTILDTNSSKKILNDTFVLKLENDTLAFKSTYKGASLDFEKSKNYMYIDSDKMPSEYINHFLGKSIFKDGKCHLYIDGKNKKELNGIFFMHDATIKDLKFFNNLMAFINTVPSLVTFKNPKFNENGYEVKDGFISFTRKGNTIAIDEITLKGYSADISGRGVLFLDSEKIELDLQISTLKSISGAINSIPILKDIILGDNGRIYTNITVRGTLDKPDITTNILTDTILTPVNIIKRTIQLPFKIFK
jgi:hypothetical protein